jgi:hypothetical protein
MADRTPRSLDLRENAGRVASWKPPSILPDPNPQEGYVFRWVSVAAGGEDQAANVTAQMNEGYEPVLASEHSEIKVRRPKNAEFGENILIGNSLLCKAPAEIINQRAQHYENWTRQQIDAVDNNMFRENDPRAPLLRPERASSVMRHR